MPRNSNPQKFTITTAGGTGQVTLDGSGELMRLSIQTAVMGNWDLDITDDEAFGVFGRNNNIGDTSFIIDQQPANAVTITISNASDGLFTGRLWRRIG
jgi:hypothetical protein